MRSMSSQSDHSVGYSSIVQGPDPIRPDSLQSDLEIGVGLETYWVKLFEVSDQQERQIKSVLLSDVHRLKKTIGGWSYSYQ